MIPRILSGALLWCVLESRYCWSSTGLAGDAYGVCVSNIPSFLSIYLSIVAVLSERRKQPQRSTISTPFEVPNYVS